jgi:hypothetical protein
MYFLGYIFKLVKKLKSLNIFLAIKDTLTIKETIALKYARYRKSGFFSYKRNLSSYSLALKDTY